MNAGQKIAEALGGGAQWEFYDDWAAFPFNQNLRRDGNVVGEFAVGLNAPDGGTYGEWRITFRRFNDLRNETHARVEAFGDSWAALHASGLIPALADIDGEGPQGPDEIRAVLLGLGFIETTEALRAKAVAPTPRPQRSTCRCGHGPGYHAPTCFHVDCKCDRYWSNDWPPDGIEVLRDDWSAAYGTSLRGYLDVAYADLVRTFGEPSPGDGRKQDAQWALRWPDGLVATLYNYKDGPNYLGDEGTPVEDIREWHVGGFPDAGDEPVERVRAALAEER